MAEYTKGKLYRLSNPNCFCWFVPISHGPHHASMNDYIALGGVDIEDRARAKRAIFLYLRLNFIAMTSGSFHWVVYQDQVGVITEKIKLEELKEDDNE